MTKAAKLARKNDTLKALVDRQAQKIAALEEELRLALHKRFAASSEKTSPDQLNLFNEAEQTQSKVAAIEEAATSRRRPFPNTSARRVAASHCPTTFHVCALNTTFPKLTKPAPVAVEKRASAK
jgi:transposase